MRRSLVILVSLVAFCVTATFAQQPDQTAPDSSQNVQQADVDRELWDVLKDWSEKSAGFERLEGEILRREYETTFAVERVGTGYFYYEAPDKGRLDLNAVTITPQMLTAREQKGAKVKRREKDGAPFTLESGQPMKWICDGQRVINIDVDVKTASVNKLPEELRGGNIMNGPLPFLFGLPPLEAVNRFALKLTRAPTQQSPFAILKAIPKRSDDASSWKEAEVILDTRTGLPAHVRLLRPSGNLEDVYSFSKLRMNRPGGKIFEFFGRRPFKVDLRDYQVKLVEGRRDAPAEQRLNKNGAPSEPVIPNLVGLPHNDAEAELKRLGIPRGNIKKLRGDPAERSTDIYRVQQQSPPPGKLIDTTTLVSLYLWTKA